LLDGLDIYLECKMTVVKKWKLMTSTIRVLPLLDGLDVYLECKMTVVKNIYKWKLMTLRALGR
jgi:hypothetical protein